jgi:hypothetical protein
MRAKIRGEGLKLKGEEDDEREETMDLLELDRTEPDPHGLKRRRHNEERRKAGRDGGIRFILRDVYSNLFIQS